MALIDQLGKKAEDVTHLMDFLRQGIEEIESTIPISLEGDQLTLSVPYDYWPSISNVIVHIAERSGTPFNVISVQEWLKYRHPFWQEDVALRLNYAESLENLRRWAGKAKENPLSVPLTSYYGGDSE